MYYNKTLLQKQGIELPSHTVPMPWATFRELAIQPTKRGRFRPGSLSRPRHHLDVLPVLTSGDSNHYAEVAS